MYGTNGLTLNGLYPYGEQHGDTTRTGYDLSTATLLQPIYNLIGLGSHGLTATKYLVSYLYMYVKITLKGMSLFWYVYYNDVILLMWFGTIHLVHRNDAIIML